MKIFLLFSVICATYFTWSEASCTAWADRMKKYSKLTDCKYFVTSESQYKKFIPYYHNEKDMSETHLMKLRFFTLAKKTFRISLTRTKDSDFPNIPTSTVPPMTSPVPPVATSVVPPAGSTIPPWFSYRSNNQHPTSMAPQTTTYRPPQTTEAWNPETEPTWQPPTTTTVIPTTSSPSPANTENYEIVIGSVVEREIYENNNYRIISHVESFVRNSKQRITTLLTPGIIRNDEPNEVLVELFKDGNLKVTVNGVDEIFAQLKHVNHLGYFSFAADKDNQREEFFYYCNQN